MISALILLSALFRVCNGQITVATGIEFLIWGGNEVGTLGIGDSTDRYTPTLLNTTLVMTSIVIGGKQSYYHINNGILAASGSNANGQLGTLDKSDRFTPTAMSVSFPNSTIVGFSASRFHTLALASSGKVFAFGFNKYGQLGNGYVSTEDQLQASQVVQDSGILVSGVDAGYYHSVLISRGRVLTFGWNNEGQLGVGDSVFRYTPTLVYGNMTSISITEIATGVHHTLACTRQGQVYSWGLNANGQLGLGQNDTMNRFTPSLIGFALSSLSILTISSGGGYRSFTMTQDGILFGWGQNDGVNGALGVGDDVERHTPTLIFTSSSYSILQFCTGSGHSLFLSQRGNFTGLYSYGANIAGQLGLGDTVFRNSITLLMKVEHPESSNIICGFYNSGIWKLQTFISEISTTAYNGTPRPNPMSLPTNNSTTTNDTMILSLVLLMTSCLFLFS